MDRRWRPNAMEEEIVLPALSESLVVRLEMLFPDKCPDLTEEQKDVWFKSGQVSVIRFLRQTYNEQLQKNILTKD
jgi:hypothetical protein